MPETVHQLGVKEFVLPPMESGDKDLEVRLGYPTIRKIKVGDVIVFNEVCARRVVAIREYKSLEETVKKEDCSRIMPGASETKILAGLRKLLRGNVSKLGVMVFELKPL